MNKKLIKNATVITVDGQDRVFVGDIAIDGGEIVGLEPNIDAAAFGADEVIDASGMVAFPGFVQTHIHLCQTLFRNLADDLELIDWLRTRIWPYEAAHDPASLRASADIGLAELIRSGTTSLLDMGTVHHTEALAEAMIASGIRGFTGKCMMDFGDEVPSGLAETTAESLKESERLCGEIKAAGLSASPDGALVDYAFCPRFALSCTTELLREVGEMAPDLGALIHTHSSETEFEIAETTRLHGARNVNYLEACGITGEGSVFAHGVWLDDAECDILRDTKTAIAHCPSSNLKLASGIAPIPKLLDHGVRVSLGADGAPCNNTLDAFTEMRHAALIQKPIHGPRSMPAERVFRLATMDGAIALGIDDRVGSLELGKRADLVLVRLNRPHNGVADALFSTLVYATYPENVDSVFVDGKALMRKGELLTLDEERVLATARTELRKLLKRAE